MGSRMWQFLLLLSVGCCRCLVWNNLNVMEESFGKLRQVGNNVMTSMDMRLEDIRKDLESFITYIDNDKMISSIRSLPKAEHCLDNDFNLETFRKSLIIRIIEIGLPVSARARHLEERYNEIEASFKTYKSLADIRWWICKFRGSDCTQDVENWLSSELTSLSCRITPDCMRHKVSKRSWESWEFNSHQTLPPPPPPPLPVCAGGEFECDREAEHICIEFTKVCDGNIDCSDGSDERECVSTAINETPRNCSLNYGEFLCENKKCIGLSEVCDGSDSCGDGSDEGGECGLGSCDGGCNEGVCFRGPKGAFCLSRCPSGLYESPSGCVLGGFSPDSTLSELLNDIPSLLKRQISAYFGLRRQATEAIAKYLNKAARCRQSYFVSIGSIYNLNVFKQSNLLKSDNKTSPTTSAP